MSSAARILLIEDDPGIRDTVQRVLAAEGYEVTVEKRGDDGLACAAKDRFKRGRFRPEAAWIERFGPGSPTARASTSASHHSHYGLWHDRDGH
jgi:hypothetical protein